MTSPDPKHLSIAMQAITVVLVAWFSFSVDAAISAAHRLPVVEQVVSDQGRRIERLEAMDQKIDKIAESVAGLMVAVRK